MPRDEGNISGRVTLSAGNVAPAAAASLCVCTTGTGGFGISGINTFGASLWNGSASGCSRGKTITTLAIATCKPTDANVVHRLLEET